jgi:hypothetical protein
MKSVRQTILKFKNASTRPALALVGVVALSIIGIVIDASRAPKTNRHRLPAITEAGAKKLARQERNFKIERRYQYLMSLGMDLKFKGNGDIVGTGGQELSTLTLKFPSINRTLVNKMSTENHFLAKLGGLGFKSVTFTDGRDTNWTFDFTTYHWRLH